MASGDGVITRQEIITDEALSFGKEYRKNVDEAIKANDELIGQFKTLLKITAEYRKSQNTNDYREQKAKEQKANQEILNSIKQMEQAERALERIRQEKLKTERELLKIAKENIQLSASQVQKASQAEQELEKVKQERLKTERELARLAQENERLNKQQAQTAITNEKELQRVKQELIRTEREATKLSQDKLRLEKLEADQKKRTTTLTMEERVQQQLANQTDKQAILAKMNLLQPYKALNAQRTIAKQKLQDLIATGNASNQQIRQAQKEFDLLDKKVKKADNAVGDFTKNVGNYKSALSGLSSLMGAFGIVGGITGVVMLGKSIYQTTKEIQAQEIALKMLSETEIIYAKNKQFLTRITEQYGLELLTTTNAYKNFFASAKTSVEEGKLAFNDMQMIFEKVSKSSSTLGLSVEQQEGAFLALSQMLSKGTVQSEELRGQLGERLPGAFEVMAKSMGVTTMELGDMLKKGEVLAADVLPKFAIAYEKAIGAEQIERVETLAAAENRLKNEWTDFVNGLNKGQGTIAKTGIEFFNLTSKILELISAKNTLSSKIIEEQDELNMLIQRIRSTNISNKERLRLIEELKLNYPGLIDNIDSEKVSNNLLLLALDEVNSAYEKRILLQSQVENEDETRDKLKGRIKSMSDNTTKLYHTLNKIARERGIEFRANIEDIDKSSQELIDKIQKGEGNKSYWSLKLNGGVSRIKDDLHNIKTQRESIKELNEELKVQSKLTESIQKDLGIQTEEQLNFNKSLGEQNKLIDELYEKAKEKGFKNISGKPTTIEDLQSFLNKPDKSEESEKERKKRETAEKKAAKEAEKLEDARLKKQKETYEAEIDLKIWRADSLAEINKAESINDKNSQDDRYNALIASQKAEEESLKLNVEKQLTLARSFQKDKEAFTESELNNLTAKKEILNQVNTLTNEELLILEKFYAAQEKLRKNNQKGLEENVKFEVEQLKKKIQEKSKSIQFDNNKKADVEISELNMGNSLGSVEAYEKAVYEIKRKYMLLSLQEQLNSLNEEIEAEKECGTVTQDMLEEQLKLKEELRKFEVESQKISLDKAKEIEQRFIEMGQNIKDALVNLTNAIFDNRIQRIDEDIERSDEYYSKQYDLYEGDAERQKVIREEQEKAREKLEAKKRKEQQKQAIFNKAMAITEIGWDTAKAIMGAIAAFPLTGGMPFTLMAGIAGAIQTAAVLASPIPKYKTGRKGGPEELAIVGDGGVHEVIEHKDGSAELTPSRDTLVKLLEGDTVHASLDLYRKSRENKINNDISKQKMRLDAYHSLVSNDNSILEQKLDILIETLKKKNMSPVVNVPKVDFAHELWLEKQKRW